MLFTRPPILWLLLASAVALTWFLVWSWRRKQALRVRFVAARLLPQLTARVSPTREKVRLALVFAAVLSLFLALAGPRWGFTWEEAHQRGLDIVVAIDTSRSMLARDIAPNRLARAQLAAYDLMRLARQDRMGLVAFAGVAFLQCPLTLDDEAYRQSVEALATDIIPQGGTALAGAIDAALGAYKDENNFKTLVLLTDGEDHDEGTIAAAERAKKAGLRIFTLGVGTPEGEVVQVTDDHGATSYVKDEQGNVVKSRLNEGLLQRIATITGGFYLPLRAARSIETLYEKGLAPLPKTEIASRLYKRFHERFYWPLGLALLLLMIEAVLPPGRRDPIPKSVSATPVRAALGLIFALSVQTAAFASVGGALKDYEAGRYLESRQEFERLLEQQPEDARLHFNAGAAAYRAGQLGQAARSFTNALRSTDLTLQQRAFYNLGNTLYRVGEAEPEPEAKAQPWQSAVGSFEAALNLDPKDEDARANLAFVKKQLEQLQQQQQQQQQNQPSDDQKSDSSEKSEDKQQPDSKPKSQPKPDEKSSQSEEQSPSDPSSESKPQPQPDPKDPQAGQDGAGRDQPQEPETQPQSQAGQGQSGQETNAPNATATAEGVMTAAQAQQLLDAQKSEERLFLFLPAESTNQSTDRVLKNW